MKIKKVIQDGVCAAMRCKATEELADVSGAAWGIEKVKLCPRHARELAAEPTVIVPSEQLDMELQRYVEEAQGSLQNLKDYEPKTQEQLEEVGEWLQHAKERRVIIEDREKEITVPINLSLAKVRELFRPAKTFWKEVEGELRNKVSRAKLQEQSTNEKALQEAAEAHAQGDTARTQAALASVTTVRNLSGVSARVKWDFEVKDAELVPREYLMVDLSKLRAYCALYKEDETPEAVPGVEFKKAASVLVRT